MSRFGDLRVVVGLACLTGDRTDAEQRALLRVADAVDFDLNRATVTNRGLRAGRGGWLPSCLYDLVQMTRSVSDVPGVGQHRVELKKRRGVWPRAGHHGDGMVGGGK